MIGISSYKFGFGCMRLPMNGAEVDEKEFTKMVDLFMNAGLTYFDTAHGYLAGKSETAIRDCLVGRYPRESYTLTDKLTVNFFNKEEDIRPFFEQQLQACGVEYFDYYLMHAQNAEFYKKYKKCRAYEIAQELKAEGKIRHVGISFHDKAEVLEMILSEHPEIEVVQIQFNYVDYEDPGIESRKCLEVCENEEFLLLSWNRSREEVWSIFQRRQRRFLMRFMEAVMPAMRSGMQQVLTELQWCYQE